MLRPICQITITQQPVGDWPNRKASFSFDFINEIEADDSWEDLTNEAKLIIPRKMYFNSGGKKITWFGKNLTGGNDTPPLILRGDKVEIQIGYKYFTGRTETSELNTVFSGFVSAINNSMPVEIKCEDEMYLFKQVSASNKLYPAGKNNLQIMLTGLLAKVNAAKGTNFTAVTTDPNNPTIQTNIGDFRTVGETVAQVLKRLEKDYRIESFIRGNELRCSGIVYYPQDRVNHIFGFQENIISDELEYRRLDDYSIGVKAYSVNEVELTETTSTGKKRTKKKRLSVFITKDSKGNIKQIPEDGFDGEKRTLYLWDVKTTDQLAKMAGERMNRLYYEGFFGKFTVFGLPYVKQGDTVQLRDNILPERNGTYMVKSVKYLFGYDIGIRQEIEVDIRIDQLQNNIAL